MKNRRNFYRLLQVQADAPVEVVKASYRAIMQQLRVHPDLGGDHAEAALLNEAFATLSDPDRRAEYDQGLKPVDSDRQREEPPPSPPPVTPVPVARPAVAEPARPPTCSFCSAPCPRAQVEWQEGACTSCGSPLFPATKHKDGEDTRRAIGRVPRNMPVVFWLASSGSRRHAGTTEDFSLNGMRFLSTAEVLVGTRVRIECDFCSAVAVVRRAVRDKKAPSVGWHCGVEFLTLRFRHERGGILSTIV